MRDACARAVAREMGRELNQAELRDIEVRVARHQRLLARANPTEWAGKSEDERLTEAGVAAARELVTEMRRRKQNLETRVIRMTALTDFVDSQVADGADETRLSAFSRILAPRADAGGTPEGGALDQKAQGIYGDAVRSLVDVFEAGKRRGIWRFIPFNEPGTNNILRRALAGETKDIPPEFVRMAKLAHDYIDLMRRRYNSAGGAIGHLEDWGEPHRWSDIILIREAKKRGDGNIEAGRRAIAKDFAEASIRGRYIHEDGRVMTMEEVTNFMDNALQTIITGGANKRLRGETSEHSVSVAANRHRAHREIHLRPDAVVAMLDKYSELGAMESLLLHMRTLARDVSLIETFGPNADLTAKQMIQRAYDEDINALPDKANRLETERDHAEYLYDYLAGNVQGRRNGLNATASFLRSWATFKSLGFTVWSSLTDPVVMQHVAAARGLDGARLWMNDVAQFAGFGRRWAKRAGLITDTVAGYADRLSYDHLSAPDVGARAASFTLKATWLNWVTEARRAAFGLTFMDAIGHLVRHNKSLAEIKSTDDSALLRLMNVSEETWGIWRLAKVETRGANHTILSPQSLDAIPDADLQGFIDARTEQINAETAEKVRAIYRMSDQILDAEAKNRAAEDRYAIARRTIANLQPELLRRNAISQLLGIVKDETNTAITTAGARERSAMLGDQTKSGAGTIGGELRRAAILFRSFPWTFATRQWDLAKSIDGGANRAAYAASLIVTTWMTGILINWIYDLFNGRDPGAVNPNSAEGRRNIVAGLVRGGGLGIFSDFLFANSDPGSRSQSLTSTLTGPVLSQIDDVQQLTLGNLNQAAMGEDANFGPEAASFVQRQVTPNWFYTKSILDRYVFNAIQEELEPGYNARRRQRQFASRGTTYWAPATPEDGDIRMPDWSRAVEGDMPETPN